MVKEPVTLTATIGRSAAHDRQLRADALVELCRRGITAPTSATRITLTVVAGVESFGRFANCRTAM